MAARTWQRVSEVNAMKARLEEEEDLLLNEMKAFLVHFNVSVPSKLRRAIEGVLQ